MPDSSNANLQLKKRARRRLVGAVAFAGLAAVVLPMVMDEEPKQQVQDVQIRIPAQDQTAFNPKVVRPAASTAAGEKAAVPEKTGQTAPPAVVVRPADKAAEKPAEKNSEKPVVKPVEKASEKVADKAAEKRAEKTPVTASEKTVAASVSEPQRAAAILSGKAVEAAQLATAGNNVPFVILIGAFSNSANVKQLQTKIGELGIKVFTEPLDSPEGKKTRVRAGPFPSRAAADKALDKLKRIGVSGVVAAKP
jgi:DedD protein